MSIKLTKDQIFQRAAATVNGEATAPDTTDTEYSTWSEFLEESNQEWPLVFPFRALNKTFNATANQSGTSVALPRDFRKFRGFPTFDGAELQEVREEETGLFRGQSYVVPKINASHIPYLLTTPLRGTGGSFVAAAIPYVSSPTHMATGSSVSPCPDDSFLVNRLKEKILKQRGDPAFTLYQEEADAVLSRMIEDEVVQFNQLDSSTKSTFSHGGFTIGQD